MKNTYQDQIASSEKLYARACNVIPNGVSSDGRRSGPPPIYSEGARGSKKWDADGNEYIDYCLGDGALLLGHQHPKIVEAVSRQAAKGTHYAASHPLEVEWGELVTTLVPSAERMRLHSSGTEATMMALRLARLFTKKEKIIKFEGHYHGWHDNVIPGATLSPDTLEVPGVIKEVINSIILCPPNDIDVVRSVIAEHDDVACVIIEPAGAGFGAIPTKDRFLRELRDLTEKHGVLLIFDEVASGFRCAPGGAQQYYNVTPDLSALGGILCGGLPGGASAGREDIMRLLEFNDNPNERIRHPGTFNSNPLTASAGVAAIKLIASGEEIEKANRIADILRGELNRIIDEHRINWRVYGDFSGFHVLMDYEDGKAISEHDYKKLKAGGCPEVVSAFRNEMLLRGVDIPGRSGFTSSAHSTEDMEKTVEACDSTLGVLEQRGLVFKKA